MVPLRSGSGYQLAQLVDRVQAADEGSSATIIPEVGDALVAERVIG
jgi:hypothetical protein